MHAEVKGTTLPHLEMILDQGEYVISTHGELSWMTPNIMLSQTTGGGQPGGGGGGLMGALKRAVGGGSIFLTKYESTGGQGMVCFATKVPGRIFPVEIGPGQFYCVHRHGWVCGTPGIIPSMAFQQTFRGGLWGGDGFIMQKLEGQGTAWIELSGEITTYELQPGQTMLAHPGHVGMYLGSVNFTVQRLPGIMNRAFGQDGTHVAVLTGPGNIWLQSMPLPILAHAIQPYVVPDAAGAGAAGGLLGGAIGRNF
jgi:uncharacterized protein (AIM24 family)